MKTASWALAALALLGCARPHEDLRAADPAVTQPASETRSDGELAWATAGTVEVSDEGISGELEIPLPDGLRFFALRVSDANGVETSEACFHAVHVTTSSGDELAAPPSDAASELAGGEGRGVFAFPRDGRSLGDVRGVRARWAFHDCRFGGPARRGQVADLPRAIRIEIATERAPAPDGSAKLDVVLFGAAEDDALEIASSIARDKLGAAGITATFRFEPLAVDAVLRFAPGDSNALDDVRARAVATLIGARVVPVIVTPCLVRDDPTGRGWTSPLGWTSHVPGVDARSAAVFVSTGDCPSALSAGRPLEPAGIGVVIAHEIGHFLGLAHADRDEALHTGAPPSSDIMTATPSVLSPAEAAFTPLEARIVSFAPTVRFEAP
ncbi:MAG: hypothetical protein KF819_18290 [Labilithrix sp.]|nr:hypothetical protein [Labilithrix sp.]